MTPPAPTHELVVRAARLHRTMSWLERHAIVFVGALTLATLLFGTLGERVGGGGAPVGWVDATYKAVQIAVFNSGGVADGNLWLVLARLTAMGAAAIGLAEIARRMFDLVMQRAWVRSHYSGHTIVCGLDDAGWRLCENLVQSGAAVVAVEREASNPNVGRARDLGVLVHIGDPADVDDLEAVRVERAAWLIALSGDMRIAAAARSSLPLGARKHPLQCLIAIPQVSAEPRPMLLSQRRFSSKELNVVQVDHEDRAASILVAEAGVFRSVLSGASAEHLRRVLVLGDTRLCERLVGVLAWEAAIVTTPVAKGQTLEVTVVHPRSQEIADVLRETLKTRIEKEEHLPKLVARRFAEPLELALDGVELLTPPDDDGKRTAAFDYVFVQCATPDQTWAAAEFLARRFTMEKLTHVPLVLGLVHGDAAHDPALQPLHYDPNRAGAAGGDEGPLLFYLHDPDRRSLTADRLLGVVAGAPARPYDPRAGFREGDSLLDRLAARTHWVYTNWDRRTKQEPVVPESQIRDLWQSEEHEERRESSRQFVRDIDRKLALVGCSRAPDPHGDVPHTSFTPVEIECLARAEHERWLVERWERGWAQAVTKDVARKLSDALVPWHGLPAETREIDRELIRRLQEDILGPEGFAVVRGPAAPATEA